MIFRKPVTIKRKAPGQFTNGVWQDGAETTFSIEASVQPTTPEDLQSLPESRRMGTSYRLYTDIRLFTVTEKSSNPDVAVIDGEDYEIAMVSIWQNNIIPHYKAIAVRDQVDQ